MSLSELSDLSEREQDILRLVATGAGNKQIAAQLFISTNTVRVHLRNIFSKIGVTSRTEAAMYALRAGLVTLPPSAAAEASAETAALPVADVAVPRRRWVRWAIAAALSIFLLSAGGVWLAVQPRPTP